MNLKLTDNPARCQSGPLHQRWHRGGLFYCFAKPLWLGTDEVYWLACILILGKQVRASKPGSVRFRSRRLADNLFGRRMPRGGFTLEHGTAGARESSVTVGGGVRAVWAT